MKDGTVSTGQAAHDEALAQLREAGTSQNAVQAEHDYLIQCARDLLADGYQPEYARGILELVGDVTGRPAEENRAGVAAELGITDLATLYR